MIVTIKNEDPVELVLNSTCESSCFLVTKIFNKIWCFYFLQSEIVDDVLRRQSQRHHRRRFRECHRG